MDGRLEAGLVVRHRLLAVLARRFDVSMVLISAGPGFGKTTLLRQALADPAAAGVDVFHTVRRSGADAASLLDELGAGLGRSVGSASDVVDAIWSRSPAEVCVVLDDVHLLDPAAAAILDDVTTSLPANGHLVLSGRSLPVVASRRSVLDGSVVELGGDDLVFDTDELAVFERLRGGGRHGASVDRWPALAELAVRVGGDHAIQYLLEEVIGGLAPDVRRAARLAAVHTTVDDELLVALGVDDLSTTDLAPALPLATRAPDGSFEIHDLLRSALLADLDAAEQATAEGRLADVFVRRGDLVTAVDLAARAGRTEILEQIARELALDLHVGDATQARRRLLERLREHLGSSLALEVSDAVVTLVDQPDLARPLLRSAAAAARQAGDGELESVAELRLAEEAYYAADLAAVRAAGRRVAELASEGSGAARRTSFLPEVWGLSLRGRHAEIVERLGDRRGLDRSDHPRTVDTELTQLEDFHRIVHAGYAGHVRSALDAITTVADLPTGAFANRLAGFTLVQRWHLGELTSDDLAEARRLVEHIESMGQAHLVVEGAATTSLFHASFGDLAIAEELLELAFRHRHRLPRSGWARHTIAQAEAVLALFDGREDDAARTLRAAIEPVGIDRLPRFVYGLTAPVSYLLLPETRATWDDGPGGPDHQLRRDVGHALVALREHDDPAPAATLPWSTPHRLRPWAFEPLLAELAVAAAVAGAADAPDVLATCRHDPRRYVSGLAGRPTTAIAEQAGTLLRVLPSPPRTTLTVGVLGPTTVTGDEQRLGADAWARRPRVRDLLLLLAHHRRIARADVARLMWPTKSASAAAGNLRFTLNQLLGALEPDRAAAAPGWFVRAIGDELHLVDGDRLTVDADRFRSEIAAARFADREGRPGVALDHFRAAIGIYRGPYLADASDDEWGYLERIHLQGEFVDAVGRTCELLVGADELAEAEAVALAGVEAEPLNELASRSLATVLLSRGRLGTAREVVAGLLAALDECQLDPEPDTLALATRLRVVGRASA